MTPQEKIDKLTEEVKALRGDFWYHKGGEDDSYGGKTEPISYKEAYEEGIRYDKDMRKMMQEACNKIKKDPNWTYGENAYPSPHERAIVAGCQKAVKELQAENKALRETVVALKEKLFYHREVIYPKFEALQAEDKKLTADLDLLKKEHKALKGNNLLLEEDNRKLKHQA